MGWAFKKDTNDTRESAAIYVADYLLNEQAELRVYDPKVVERQVYADLDYLGSRTAEQNRASIGVGADPYEVCKGAHAIAVLTEWDEFKDYDWERIYDGMLKPAKIFDGRNLLDADKLRSIGFIVQSIGTKSLKKQLVAV
ncbi:UDP binding domain-containing protein [Pedobacter panaciterrae]